MVLLSFLASLSSCLPSQGEREKRHSRVSYEQDYYNDCSELNNNQVFTAKHEGKTRLDDWRTRKRTPREGKKRNGETEEGCIKRHDKCFTWVSNFSDFSSIFEKTTSKLSLKRFLFSLSILRSPSLSLPLSLSDSTQLIIIIIMKIPTVSSFLWTLMAVVVAIAFVAPSSVEAGKDKASHTIIVKSGGGC